MFALISLSRMLKPTVDAEVLRQSRICSELGAVDFHFVDVVDDTQQAKGSNEEFEELHVVDGVVVSQHLPGSSGHQE